MIEYLQELGVNYWFDAQEILSGDSVPEKINDGLRNCSHGVLVLSENYLSNKYWTLEELWGLINKESVGGKRILIPIRYGLDHGKLTNEAPLIAHRLSFDFKDKPKGAADEIKRVLRGNTLTARLETGAQIPDDGLPSPHNVPLNRPIENGLLGRKELLETIIAEIKSDKMDDLSGAKICVLSGIPGVGKSTILCELAYCIGRQFFGGVVWLKADNSIALENSIKDACAFLKLGTMDGNMYSSFLKYTEENPCFIILDALDSREAYPILQKILPKTGQSRIIISTRAEKIELPLRFSYFYIKELEPDPAVKLLVCRRGVLDSKEREFAYKICYELGYLPLALYLASLYLGRHSLSLEIYLNRLIQQGAKWKALNIESGIAPSVASIFSQCLSDIKRDSLGSFAEKILRRCVSISITKEQISLLDKRGTFRNHNEYIPNGLATAVDVDTKNEAMVDDFEDSITLLENTGIIRRINSGNNLWLHSLTIKYFIYLLDEEDAWYIQRRLHLRQYEVYDLMATVGWINGFDSIYETTMSVLPIMKQVSTDASLSTLGGLYNFADFYGIDKADMILDEAIELAEVNNVANKYSSDILHFKIFKAYTAYKHKRFDDAKTKYEQVMLDLEETGIEIVNFLDCLYYFGCLLLDIGNIDNKERTLKYWDIAIKYALDELELLYDRNIPEQNLKNLVFNIKLRLCRLLQAKLEIFINLAENEINTLEALKLEMEPFLGANLDTWNRQFLNARGAFHILMSVRMVQRL